MNEIRKNADALSENDEAKLIQSEIAKLTPTRRKRFFKKFLLAALGSIPWVGGFISTMASLKTETGDVRGIDDAWMMCFMVVSFVSNAADQGRPLGRPFASACSVIILV